MDKLHYKKTLAWIEINRFQLLLISTLLVLVLPAFTTPGLLSDIVLMTTMSFLFIQSLNAANIPKAKRRRLHFIVLALIVVTWFKPMGINHDIIEVIKLLAIVAFFGFVIFNLFKFIVSETVVDMKVLLTAINIYLLAGIVGACLAFIIYTVYPNSYNFPAHIENSGFVSFMYYSFVTMSTLGYGDILPAIPETQTLAFLLSIAGQLYVAIIIAILIGKFLMQASEQKANNGDRK